MAIAAASVTLRTAFALSINTVAASVASEDGVGPARVADVARRLGIENMPARNAFRAALDRAGFHRDDPVGHDRRFRRLHG